MVDMKAAVKSGPQVAKKGITDLFQGRKDSARQQVASKDASGKVRITDLDDATVARLSEKKAPPKTGGTKLASGTARPGANNRRDDLDDDVAAVDDAFVTTSKPPARSVSAAKRPAAAKSRTAKVVADDFDPDLDEFSPDGGESPVGRARASKPDGNSIPAAKNRAPVKSRSARPANNSFDPELEIDDPSVTQFVDELESPKDQVPETPQRAVQKKKTDRPATAKLKLAKEEAAPDTARAPGSPHERRRADQLMQRAYAMYRSGYPEEALRLASVAVELEKSQQAIYGRGEERPSDFITWLQSGDAAGIPAAPVITPQPRLDQQSDDPVGSDLDVTAFGTKGGNRRRPGEALRGNAGPAITAKSNPANEPVNTARSNAGLSLTTPEGPVFQAAAAPEGRAIANAGQVEVPPIPSPRNADLSVSAAAPEAPAIDSPTTPDASKSIAKAAATSPDLGQKAGVTHLVMRPSAAVPPPVDELRDDSDPISETELSALTPVRSSQLTIVSLIGLIAGIAGMFGLSWWRIQESRHFATGK